MNKPQLLSVMFSKMPVLRTILTASTRSIAPAMFLSTTAIFAQPSQAVTNINIACDTEGVTPRVLGVVSNEYRSQNTEILNFLPKYFSSAAALEQCQSTANTLKRLYSIDRMNYLSSDTINGKPTICVVERRGVGCESYNSQILFSLNESIDPSQVLYDMLGKGFKQSQLPATRTVGRIYTNIKPFWWPF
jgi:hypothetical protein